MNYENVISEKLGQLDWLYSTRMHIQKKAKILCEMIELVREAGLEIIDEEKWLELLARILSGGLTPQGEATAEIQLNRLKAKLISKCVKAGLIKGFKEIPVAGLEEIEEMDV